MESVRIATRESSLALWQANYAKNLLEHIEPDLTVELVPLTTTGDRDKASSLAGLGGKGVFVKELELALLNGQVDLAIHSMKDVPVELQDNLTVHTIGERANPSDSFVSLHSLIDQEPNIRIGSSSLRRKALLAAIFNRNNVVPMRGNVGTRLEKLDAGDCDALILATAGLQRLGLSDRIQHELNPIQFVPSAGQAALAAEFAGSNDRIKALLMQIQILEVENCVASERAVVHNLGANCSMPIGVHCFRVDREYRLTGVVLASDGSRMIKAMATCQHAREAASRVSNQLLDMGARDFLGSE